MDEQALALVVVCVLFGVLEVDVRIRLRLGFAGLH
jgi:hypothetical protein